MAGCPRCASARIYKGGFLKSIEGPIQRFQCAECGRRFTHHKPKMNCLTMNKGRICAILLDAENLTSATKTKTVAVKLENTPQETKGKIIEYCFHLQKQSYSPETNRLNRTALKVLVERGAELLHTESVKEVIAKQKT
jgi:transposase-like protein